MAYCPRLRVRVSRDEVVQHVGKKLTADRNPQLRHVGEVGFAQLSSPMLLNKIHFLRRTFARPPLLDPALQSPQLPIRKTLRILPLQRSEDCFRLQPGIRPDLLSDHRPDFGKSILSSPPVPIRFHFARQPPSPEVFPRRFHVHARLRRRYLLRILSVRQFLQPPYLLFCPP